MNIFFKNEGKNMRRKDKTALISLNAYQVKFQIDWDLEVKNEANKGLKK